MEVPIVVTSAFAKTALDAAYLTNLTVFVMQTFSITFIMYTGQAIARALPNGKRHYRLYFFLAGKGFVLAMISQTITWTYFGASVERLTNWTPIAGSAITAISLFVATVHMAWVTLSMARNVKYRLENEKELAL